MLKIIKSLIFIFFILTFGNLAQGQTDYDLTRSEILEQFSGFNPDSKAKIQHDPLTAYLIDTVFPGWRSKRFLGQEKVKTYNASHIKTSESLAPSRFENSRVFIFAFSDDHVDFFQAYQQGLENVSNRRAISTFNRNEQLAYWLNLYNVIVMNKLVAEYPVHELDNIFEKGGTSFKDEKVTTIEGTPLSLHDIEAILFNNYDSPLVVFGLWQGSIGGPRLLNYAFTGTNVWQVLEKNAVEFVNSNRGMRPPRGDTLKVSEFYEWMLPAFGKDEGAILGFIKRYADPNFVDGIQRVTSIKASVYDWTITDLLSGILHTGQYNQLGGVQQSHGGGKLAAAGISVGPALYPIPEAQEGSGGPYVGYNPTAVYNFILGKTPPGPLTILPPAARGYVEGILENNDLPETIITSEECAPDEACGVSEGDKQAAP